MYVWSFNLEPLTRSHPLPRSDTRMTLPPHAPSECLQDSRRPHGYATCFSVLSIFPCGNSKPSQNKIPRLEATTATYPTNCLASPQTLLSTSPTSLAPQFQDYRFHTNRGCEELTIPPRRNSIQGVSRENAQPSRSHGTLERHSRPHGEALSTNTATSTALSTFLYHFYRASDPRLSSSWQRGRRHRFRVPHHPRPLLRWISHRRGRRASPISRPCSVYCPAATVRHLCVRSRPHPRSRDGPGHRRARRYGATGVAKPLRCCLWVCCLGGILHTGCSGCYSWIRASAS